MAVAAAPQTIVQVPSVPAPRQNLPGTQLSNLGLTPGLADTTKVILEGTRHLEPFSFREVTALPTVEAPAPVRLSPSATSELITAILQEHNDGKLNAAQFVTTAMSMRIEAEDTKSLAAAHTVLAENVTTAVTESALVQAIGKTEYQNLLKVTEIGAELFAADGVTHMLTMIDRSLETYKHDPFLVDFFGKERDNMAAMIKARQSGYTGPWVSVNPHPPELTAEMKKRGFFGFSNITISQLEDGRETFTQYWFPKQSLEPLAQVLQGAAVADPQAFNENPELIDYLQHTAPAQVDFANMKRMCGRMSDPQTAKLIMGYIQEVSAPLLENKDALNAELEQIKGEVWQVIMPIILAAANGLLTNQPVDMNQIILDLNYEIHRRYVGLRKTLRDKYGINLFTAEEEQMLNRVTASEMSQDRAQSMHWLSQMSYDGCPTGSSGLATAGPSLLSQQGISESLSDPSIIGDYKYLADKYPHLRHKIKPGTCKNSRCSQSKTKPGDTWILEGCGFCAACDYADSKSN